MKTVAFYLPQFHTIPENDEWWGTGFTEWTNVRRAAPQFSGHDHPRVSTELGEYDLTQPEVGKRQTELARVGGVDAFCMYFYWFDGHRLLEKPVNMWRDDEDLLPYCLSWANENWTRRWDGKDKEVLAAQTYKPGYVQEIFADLVPHFMASHYLRHNGRPVLLVHRADLIPEPADFAAQMQASARDAGFEGLYLVAAETKYGLDCREFRFDAVAEFPPVGANTLASAQLAPVAGLNPSFRGRLMSYPKLARTYASRPAPDFCRHRGVMPSWDNTARRGERATIYVGATPIRYGAWLQEARTAESAERRDDGIVFINAWNEWAEGAYLEPDATNGDANLRATQGDEALALVSDVRAGKLGWAHVRSLSLVSATTMLRYARIIAARMRRFGRRAPRLERRR